MNLSEADKALMSEVVAMSPTRLAKTRGMTKKQAMACQKYFILLCTVHARTEAGLPIEDLEQKALRIFDDLPKRVQDELMEVRRESPEHVQ